MLLAFGFIFGCLLIRISVLGIARYNGLRIILFGRGESGEKGVERREVGKELMELVRQFI
jgi:hypothetical protein